MPGEVEDTRHSGESRRFSGRNVYPEGRRREAATVPLPRWERVRVRVNGADKWEVYGKLPPLHPSITTRINLPYTLQLVLQHPLKPTPLNELYRRRIP